MEKNKTMKFIFLLFLNLSAVYFLNIKITFEQILITHVFLSALSFFIDAIRSKIKRRKITSPYILLSTNFFRAATTIAFLILVNSNYEELNKKFVVNFIICYFIYLLLPFIKNKKSEIKSKFTNGEK